MRISDWSSDVCSSDLPVLRWVFRRLSPRISRDFGLLLPHLGFLRGFLMSAILEKLQNTVIAGIVLLVIIVVVVGTTVSAPAFDHLWFAFLFRYLHVLSGVMWIGLLWYFNFVQIPSIDRKSTRLNSSH